MLDDSTALRALREGRFSDAGRLVPIHGAGDPEGDVISLEVFYFLGHGDRTRLSGRKLLESRAPLPASLRSKAAAVLASQYADDGDFEQALDLGRKAYSYAQQANEPAQLCAMSALLLERTCHRS